MRANRRKKKRGSCTWRSSVEIILISRSYRARGNRARHLTAKHFWKILYHFFTLKKKRQPRLYLYTSLTTWNMKLKWFPQVPFCDGVWGGQGVTREGSVRSSQVPVNPEAVSPKSPLEMRLNHFHTVRTLKLELQLHPSWFSSYFGLKPSWDFSLQISNIVIHDRFYFFSVCIMILRLVSPY